MENNFTKKITGFRNGRLIIFLAVILVFTVYIFSSGQARAAESVLAVEPENSASVVSAQHLLPDSKLYILKTGWEKVRLFFTFNQAKKAEFEEILASRRLNEVEQLLAEDKIDLAQQQLKKFEDMTSRVEERLISLKEHGQDVSALTARIEQFRLQHQEDLQNTYNQAPEDFRDQVANAMASSAAGWSKVVEAISQSEDLSKFKDKLKDEIESAGSGASSKVDEIKEKLRAQGIFK